MPLLGALLACTNPPEVDDQATGDDGTETSETGDPGDGDPGDGDPGDGDPGDGDGDGDGPGDGDGDGDGPGDGDGDEPVPDYPQPEPCEPLNLVVSDMIPLTYTYTYTVGNVDGQPGDEIVAYHQGEILSIADGVPTASPHPLPFGGVADAVLLRANEDEFLDLIVSRGSYNDDGFLYTFLGDGTGAFAYLGTRTFPNAPLFWMAAVEAPTSDALMVDVGYSSKQYMFLDALADAPSVEYDSGLDPQAGDVDGDGMDEFAIGLGGNDLEIWRREGDGYVLGTTLDCQFDGAGEGFMMTIQDVNADGLDDVVCMAELNGPSNLVALRLWSSLGALEFSEHPTIAATGWADSTGRNTHVVADLQGDGAPEFIVDHTILLQLGDDGNFGCQRLLQYPFNGNDPLRAGDVDNDGRDELVILDLIEDELLVYDLP